MKLTYATRVIILLCILLTVCLSGWSLSRPEKKPLRPAIFPDREALDAAVLGRTQAEILERFGQLTWRYNHVQDDGAPAWEYGCMIVLPRRDTPLNILIVFGKDGRVDRYDLATTSAYFAIPKEEWERRLQSAP